MRRDWSLSIALLIATSAVLAGGCASWKDPTTASDTLLHSVESETVESKKSIVIEVEFVNIDANESDPDQSASLWQWVDETSIDSNERSRLFDNGLRVGVVSSPERFRSQLEGVTIAQDVVDTFLSTASVASDVSRGKRKIPMRIGRRYELPLHQPIEGSYVTLVRMGDQTIGKSLQDPQYLFAFEPLESTGKKQLRVRFRPEIQHGEMRQNWVGSESAIRIDRRRETWSLAELDLNVNAREGDTIVIAPAQPLAGLAKQMFAGMNADQQNEQLVLLVRIASLPSAVDQL